MGYCFISGELKSGVWTFVKCNGNTNICSTDHGHLPTGDRCRECNTFCKTYKQAKKAIIEYDNNHSQI